jgi:hypothetical protein
MPIPPKGRFGPAIIGQEAFEAEQEYITEHKDVFGPAVIGDHPSTAAAAGGPHDPGDEHHEPSSDTEEPRVPSDAFVRAELARPEGMRTTALRAMLDAESQRPGADGSMSPRSEVVDTLEGMIRELTGD